MQEENDDLQQTIKDKDEYIVAAKSSVREKEQTVTKQREELMKMKRQLAGMKESNEALMEERKDDFKKMNQNKQKAVDEMKEVVQKEHKVALEQVTVCCIVLSRVEVLQNTSYFALKGGELIGPCLLVCQCIKIQNFKTTSYVVSRNTVADEIGSRNQYML